MLDYGYPQVTSTEGLKMHVHNTPIPTTSVTTEMTKTSGGKTASANSVHKPVSVGGTRGKEGNKNEVRDRGSRGSERRRNEAVDDSVLYFTITNHLFPSVASLLIRSSLTSSSA